MFQIIEPSVSGRHCEILLRGNEVVVRDLKSTNGTFIQGERITEAILKLGQILRLGRVDLRLKVSTPVASPAPVPAPTNLSSPAPSRKHEPMVDSPKASGLNKPVQAKPAGPDVGAGVVPTPCNQPEPENTPAKKHQVLFVDDNNAFLEAITELYAILGDKTWEIHRASTADQALATLQQKAIDLVVLDIGMPVLDGMQLLNLIHRRYPGRQKSHFDRQCQRQRPRSLSGQRGGIVHSKTAFQRRDEGCFHHVE